MSLRLQPQFDLTAFNTLGLRSFAESYIAITEPEQIPRLFSYAAEQNLPVLWLGGGSNLVLAESVPGIVAQLKLQGVELLESTDQSALLRVGAGEVWHPFVRWTLEQGYYGLENLALIPGSVGASPVQNIGAYGVEVCELIECVDAYDSQAQQWVNLTVEDCLFGYRDSLFKRNPGRFVISSVTFRLSRKYHPKLNYAPLAQRCGEESEVDALAVFDAVCEIRSAKLPDPATLGNAGSFFKNPVVTQAQFEELLAEYPAIPNYPADSGRKLAAGWLIEQAGLKGYTDGSVGVHKLQALVLVNYGGASKADIQRLSTLVLERVQQKFGIALEQEPISYPLS